MIKLYEFPQSHYCEKVRWALDYKNIPWESKRLVPGLHRLTVQKLCAGTSLPVIVHDGKAIQGSHEITTYLEKTFPEKSIGPESPLEKEIEQRVGIPLIMSIYYWLFQDPHLATFYYMKGLPRWQNFLFRSAMPILAPRIASKYGINEVNYLKARKEFENGINWFEGIIKPSGFLEGSKFSRADIAGAASLIALHRPPEHPYQWPKMYWPKPVADFYDKYRTCKAYAWAENIYREYR